MQRPIVVIVEDNPAVRDEVCRLFAGDGNFRIGGVASDGLEGALAAAEIQPDVVLLDVFLPRWDGWRAAEFIRSNCPDTIIVAFASGEAPQWADCTATKTEVESVVSFVRRALDARPAA